MPSDTRGKTPAQLLLEAAARAAQVRQAAADAAHSGYQPPATAPAKPAVKP